MCTIFVGEIIDMYIEMLCGINIGVFPLILIIIGCMAIGVIAGYLIYKLIVQKKIDNATKSAKKIIEDAINDAKTQKKELIIEAKDEIFKLKADTDIEIKERRQEIQKLEERLLQKEEFQNKKEQNLEQKSNQIEQLKTKLDEKENSLIEKEEQLDEKAKDIILELERVAGLSQEQAKNKLMDVLRDDARKAVAGEVRDMEEEAKENAERKAVDIITQAIQRCATDHTAEITVTSVTIPSEEMKGRLIGREGRNIRALEASTGIDLIIDDTPETIVLSSFDPLRREIAKRTIDKLMMDGRIHPAKIEEMVEKVRKDLESEMRQIGEDASYDANVHGLHPALTMLLGRLKFRTSYSQNVLLHSIEVAHLASMMASELGVDVETAKRGGLLHDIGKAVDHELEGTHTELGVQLARKYKESEAVIHCIEAHHGDVPFRSVEAILVQVADAISSSRPGARRESLETYIKRVEKLEEISSSFEGVDKAYAIQAGREVRVIVKPDEITDEDAMFLAQDIAKKVEEEVDYPGQIKINVIRESRCVNYAK